MGELECQPVYRWGKWGEMGDVPWEFAWSSAFVSEDLISSLALSVKLSMVSRRRSSGVERCDGKGVYIPLECRVDVSWTSRKRMFRNHVEDSYDIPLGHSRVFPTTPASTSIPTIHPSILHIAPAELCVGSYRDTTMHSSNAVAGPSRLRKPRQPFVSADYKPVKPDGIFRVVIISSGSVASIKIPEIVGALSKVNTNFLRRWSILAEI